MINFNTLLEEVYQSIYAHNLKGFFELIKKNLNASKYNIIKDGEILEVEFIYKNNIILVFKDKELIGYKLDNEYKELPKNIKSIKDLKNLYKLINSNDKTLNIKKPKHTIKDETPDNIWDGGTWEDGDVWEDGTWLNGFWPNGIWKNGIWENGMWEKGTWEKGTWNNGTWENGVWQNGTWEDGRHNGGTWEDGTWENGVWGHGKWKNGTWENGEWNNGIWEDGKWNNGKWNNGMWYKGWIYDPDKKGNYEDDWKWKGKYVYSLINPKEYFK